MEYTTRDQCEPAIRWEILTDTLCDGWVNTWTVMEPGQPERPETFASREEAEQALADFLEEGRLAAEAGDLAEAPDPDDYRVWCTDMRLPGQWGGDRAAGGTGGPRY